MIQIREDFLHYIWKTKQFNHLNLKDTNHKNLHILKPGTHNLHAGPDFFAGEFKCDETHWVGNIELHVYSSDWRKHGHQNDPAYDQVILHVVWEHDQAVFRHNGELIPCLELKGRISKSLLEVYDQLAKSTKQIPCENYFKALDAAFVRTSLTRFFVSRFQRKMEEFNSLLKSNNSDLEQSFYALLGTYMGAGLNQTAFAELLAICPYRLVRKLGSDVQALEGLFLGQAGFLEADFNEKYAEDLKSVYHRLKYKYGLRPMDSQVWKYGRLRPTSFPTRLIAQFAALLGQQKELFQKVCNACSLSEMDKVFEIRLNNYWDTHYVLGKQAKYIHQKGLSKAKINLLLINAVLPFRMYYRKNRLLDQYIEGEMDFFHQIKKENNGITKTFESIGFKAESAFDSQALIELKSNYCDSKKCLLCSIGNSILKK